MEHPLPTTPACAARSTPEFDPTWWSIPNVSRLSHALRWTAAAALMLLASAPAGAAPQEPGPATAAEMKPYVEPIAGTDLKFEMVPIPGGEFVMGSPADEEKRGEDEGPQHPVKIAPFWMGKCEVTWDEYDQFAFSLDLKKKKNENVDPAKQPETEKLADAVTRPTPPYADQTFGFGRKGQPAICITHHAAMEYCRWLSAKTGKVYRLPTEAEWEYASRAGSKGPFSFEDASQIGDYAWYVENTEKPQPVGKKKPNPWGLHDIHGNVAEWCLDHYAADAYKQFPADKPTLGPVILPDAREYPYVARGGSWDDDAEKLRSAARRASNPEWSVQDPQRPQSIWWHTDATFVGFRVVRALSEQENLRDLKSQVVKGKTTR
jgi:formylglycine-generating enzyme required for sulfatase activity